MENFLKKINEDLEKILPTVGNIYNQEQFDENYLDSKKIVSNIRKKLTEFRIKQKIYTKEEASIYQKVVEKFLEENNEDLEKQKLSKLFEDNEDEQEVEKNDYSEIVENIEDF